MVQRPYNVFNLIDEKNTEMRCHFYYLVKAQ